MIVFDLECAEGGHRFEGWFGSSEDFATQQARGLLACPQCGCARVSKAPMAPNVGRKGNQRSAKADAPAVSPSPSAPTTSPVATALPPLPPEVVQALHHVARAQAEALKASQWVGEKFADKARAMHYGDAQVKPIHGKASLQQAQELAEEGIEIAPVLCPVVPPTELN
jgi:hypothetical protein